MTVALLIMCHDDLGQALYGAAINTLTHNPLPTKIINVYQTGEPDELLAVAKDTIETLDNGSGVLVLTDMYGATPSNIACRLNNDHNVQVVSGINLPMLIRTLNYPKLPLQQLAEKAVSGGRDGIMSCRAGGASHG